eukprot:c37955_g1_i1.p1 GENE.c37955_g1_i1~~c37955_g1_i1.p1  ORF type:complete len:195 (-),score=70.07 c37955_g1_i1:24-608(-)
MFIIRTNNNLSILPRWSPIIYSKKYFSNPPGQPTFDTEQFAKILKQSKGIFTEEQIDALLEATRFALHETLTSQSDKFTTKGEILKLKSELNEKIFNATLKADVHQRHQRDMLEKDFKALKNEIRAAEKIDFAAFEKRIVELDKLFLQQKGTFDEDLAHIRAQVQMVEARSVKFSVGLIGTMAALGVAVARLML